MTVENISKKNPIKEGEIEKIRKAGEDLRTELGVSLFEVTNLRRYEDFRKRALQKRRV